jgi:hypothetical protein
MSEEKVKAVEAEVQRLQDVKVIREVKYPVWLANTVPVKKKNGKWRMCVDFTDLNKACKKDDFPLERVDKIVDDAANSELLSLLDMFLGYHQIRVHKEDEEKTSFITPFGTFCFVRMLEGLKNAGCTFENDRNSPSSPTSEKHPGIVYDIVVKSIQRRDHISVLAETFANLRAANLRLNPEKCVFSFHKGKVLRCLVSTKGIEANPDKIRALTEMQDPVSMKNVQKLMGRVAALNRFIPRAAERSLPFFQVLRSTKNFQWSESQKQAFQELKDYLSNMTKLCPPEPRSPLLLYVSASNLALSAVLVQEKEGGKLKQIPMYFAS